MAVAAKTPDAASVQNFRLHLPYQAFLWNYILDKSKNDAFSSILGTTAPCRAMTGFAFVLILDADTHPCRALTWTPT